jgi:anhydro-N-acetylmuramic acid kinase
MREVRRYDVEELLVCGGGVHNRYLMEQLRQADPDVEVKSTDALGVSSEQMEAMIFAWLAYKRVHREEVELKEVTGARRNGVLGGLYAKDQ